MTIKAALLTVGFQFLTLPGFSQGGPPWNNPLNIAWSTDGITFNTPAVFQDSAGVPSVIKWKGDTLIAAFQWFRQPNPSVTWDRVATKFSYDNGLTWTQPVPIVINGLPLNYQRPFDPTLTTFSNDSLRIYFSSSIGTPVGLDSTVNTYSAVSTDGIHFSFEPGSRVDELSNRVIDPAVIFFNTGWHYVSPIGAPQLGAYHYVSPDGVNFTPVANIPSDNAHNWTGNFVIENSSELRFYGSGATIWYNHSPNGGVWSGYVSTNIQGGDPSVVKISNNNYFMVFVGQPYTTGNTEQIHTTPAVVIYPNPANHKVSIKVDSSILNTPYTVTDFTGKKVLSGSLLSEITILELDNLLPGTYLLRTGANWRQTFNVIK